MNTSENDTHGIHVGDPVYKEEVCVTRGDRCIYLVKYDDDTQYDVLDEHGERTTFTWSGDVQGIADFIALADLFRDIYPHDHVDGDA